MQDPRPDLAPVLTSVFVARLQLGQFCCARPELGSKVRAFFSRLLGMKWKKKHKEQKERNKRIPLPHTVPNLQDELETACY